ncbi:MAG: hypothetical protein M3Y86_05385 [Verrucomicrobiota bacterium]|nr:hypothetical protein [Verrucomicrobiota bacterium]
MRESFAIFLLLTTALAAAAGDVPERDVLGHWYRGDHFGYNVGLTLAPDHTYTATWSGDEGQYGSASGKWKLQEARLVITPTRETQGIKGDLRTLRLEPLRGKIVLAPTAPLPVPTMFHLNPMMVFERESRAVSRGGVTLRVAPAEVTVKRGEVPTVKVTLENRTADTATVILRKGGNFGLQEPLVGWSLKPLDAATSSDNSPPPVPAVAPVGYQVVSALRRGDFFSIAPTEGTDLSDFFPLPSDLTAGRYRAVFYYILDRQMKATGTAIETNEPKVERLLRQATPCKLISNEIVLTVTDGGLTRRYSKPLTAQCFSFSMTSSNALSPAVAVLVSR